MAGRLVQVAMIAAALIVAALAVGSTATGFGTMPECGTGSYFLYPLQPMITLAFVAAVTTLAVTIAVLAVTSSWRARMVGLVIVTEAVAAAAGCALSEAAHGCDQYRDHSYVDTAAFITAAVGLVVGGIVGLTWAVADPRRGPEGATPATPSDARALGGYRVRRSEVRDLARGERVWLALSPTLLTVLRSSGAAVTMERAAVTSAVGDDGRVTVSVDGWLALELTADPGVDPWALSIALANDPT